MKLKTFKLLILSLVLLVSCTNTPKDVQQSQTISKDLFLQSLSQKQVECRCNLLNQEDYGDFINSDVQFLMDRSKIYENQRQVMTKSSVETDTLMYSEQNPSCELITENYTIFDDGKIEYKYTTEIDPEGNPALTFYEEPLELDEIVACIEIKDGIKTNYTRTGRIISREPYNDKIMTETIEEIKVSYAEYQQEETKAGFRRDAAWFMKQLADNQYTKGDIQKYTLRQLEDGNYLLEYRTEMPGTKGSNIDMLTKTVFNQEFDKMLKYEVVKNNILVERTTYKYDESQATKSIFQKDGINSYNPSEIRTEKLVMMFDNTPMISVREEKYIKNEKILHFMNK